MDVIHKNPLLEFNSDDLQCIRKKYNYDDRKKLENAISDLDMWIQEQDHFIKKDYPKYYLEGVLIKNDGNIENAKEAIDNICTFKTIFPQYYEPFDMENSYIMKIIHLALLPKMTKDHSRIFLLKNFGQHYKPGIFHFYQLFLMLCEYYYANDYSDGIIGIFDYRENNIKELVKAINFVELQRFLSIIMEGYGIQVKLKGIHYLTSSKVIAAFVALLKQALNPKLADCIHVHKDVETLCKYVPRDILPMDYGGTQKPLKELNDKWKNELSSNEFKEYFNKMKEARTNENFRSKSKLRERFEGVTSNFRNLNVD